MRYDVRTLVMLLILALAAPALARRDQDDDEDPVTAQARIHLSAGIAHFNAGRLADAEREVSAAYRLRPVPELAYNLAQCQERLGELSRAVESYEAYLKGRPQARDRAEVERRIADLRERAGAQELAAEPPPSGGAVVIEKEKVVFKEIVVYRAPPPKAGRQARYAAYGLLGLAAVGLGTGIAFTFVAKDIDNRIAQEQEQFRMNFGALSQSECPESQSRDRASKRIAEEIAAMQGQPRAAPVVVNKARAAIDSYCGLTELAAHSRDATAIGAVVGYAVLGASLIGSVGMFLYGRHLDRKQERDLRKKGILPSLTLMPYGGPLESGIVLSGSF